MRLRRHIHSQVKFLVSRMVGNQTQSNAIVISIYLSQYYDSQNFGFINRVDKVNWPP